MVFYSLISCGFMWIPRVKKHKKLNPIQLFIVVVFYKLKPIQSTTNTTEITKNLLNLVPRTIIQIGEKFSPIVYSTNLSLYTFLTIVLTLIAFLTCTCHQSDQIIAPIHLLCRRTHRVLKTHITFLSSCTQ